MPTKRRIRNPNTVKRKGDRYTERESCCELSETVGDQLSNVDVEDGENAVPHDDTLSNNTSNDLCPVTHDDGKGSSSVAPVQPEEAVTGGIGPSGVANGPGHTVFLLCWDPCMVGIWENSLSKCSRNQSSANLKEEITNLPYNGARPWAQLRGTSRYW